MTFQHDRSVPWRELETRADLLCSMQAEAIAPALWDLETERVTASLAAVGRDVNFRSVEVIDRNGTTIAARGETQDPAPGLEKKADIVHVEHGKQTGIGHLTLRLSTAKLQQELFGRAQGSLINLGVMLVVLLGATYVTPRMITGLLGGMTEVMTGLAGGNTTLVVPELQRAVEIGAVARAADVFREQMVKATRLTAEQEADRQLAEAEKRATPLSMAETIETETGSAVESRRNGRPGTQDHDD